jgi:predicted SnoaL-like aldol condensation-catalyzing enzyme
MCRSESQRSNSARWPNHVTDLDNTDANKLLMKNYFDEVVLGGQRGKVAQYRSADGFHQHNCDGEGVFDAKATAFYDLYRIENGKQVEHWDVLETVPPINGRTQTANSEDVAAPREGCQ